MRFIQFLHPDARQIDNEIKRPDDIEKMAAELWSKGYRFEIECFPDTQVINMDCQNSEGDQVASRLCPNGPQVPVKVDELVREAHELSLKFPHGIAPDDDL
jgi:hypothetical protein